MKQYSHMSHISLQFNVHVTRYIYPFASLSDTSLTSSIFKRYKYLYIDRYLHARYFSCSICFTSFISRDLFLLVRYRLALLHTLLSFTFSSSFRHA